MAYFPFMVEISGKKCLVAGGGKIALHKVAILKEFGVKLFVIASRFDAAFEQLECPQGQLFLRQKEFEDVDIEGMDFVVAATDEDTLNLHISELCRSRGIPVNVVDKKEACTFLFPALIQEGDMLVAVSSGGQSPAAVSYLKSKLKNVIPSYYGKLAKTLGELRERVLREVASPEKRKNIFYRLLAYGDAHGGEIPLETVDAMLQAVLEESNRRKCFRIGTRGSALALAQTRQVIAALQERFPDADFEQVIIRTQGDKQLDQPLASFGGSGAFVSELENALQEGKIDLAVHSAKDMPVKLADSLVIAGVLPRADARDVLVFRKGMREKCAVFGTGSPRRQFQIGRLYPDTVCKAIRGNVPTRLQKLRDGECDGLVLAAAGLSRLGLLEEADLEYRFLSYEEMVPAGGQGIIAVQGRKGDDAVRMMQELSDRNTEEELNMERCVLELLNAGCHEALGVISEADGNTLRLKLIWEKNGQTVQMDETAEAGQEEALVNRVVQGCHNDRRKEHG